MSEVPMQPTSNTGIGEAEAALLPSQQAIHALYEDLLLPYSDQINQINRNIRYVNPREVRDRLADTSMRDILVAPGERLAPDPSYSDYYGVYPDTQANLASVSVSAFGGIAPKVRRYDESRKADFSARSEVTVTETAKGITVVWPELLEWWGNVSIRFWYDVHPQTEDQNERSVGEVVLLETLHNDPGTAPELQARIAVPSDYPPYNHSHYPRLEKKRPATEQEAADLTSLIREIAL
jgi:hypothetical protein